MPTITISDASAALLTELHTGWNARQGPRTQEEIVADAIKRVHRGFYGLEPGDPDGPWEPTGPFQKAASERPAEVLLRQIDPLRFNLTQPIRYDDGTRVIDIKEGSLSDLASVPNFLTWLVPRYGKHTLAALVHDRLQGDDDYTAEEADVIFRTSMGSIGVPLLQRWLMWAAVALRSEVKFGEPRWRRYRGVIWAVLFAIVALVLWSWSTWRLLTCPSLGHAGTVGALVLGAIVLPLVLGVVWGKRYGIGALTGVALLFVTVPIVMVLLARWVYLGLGWAAERLFVSKDERNPVRAARRTLPDAQG